MLFLLCLAYYTKRGICFPAVEPLIAIVWIPEFYFCSDQCHTILITCIQRSRTQQAESSPHVQIPTLCTFKWENLYHSLEKYKWTTWATKAPVRDSTPYFPLLEGQTGLKRKKEESSELTSQSFFILDVSLLWKLSRETSNFLGSVPIFSNPLYAVINI